MNKEKEAQEYSAGFKERRQLIQLIAREIENVSKCRLEIQGNRRVAVRETFAVLESVSSCFRADLHDLLVFHGFEYDSWKERHNKDSAEVVFELREKDGRQKKWNPDLMKGIKEGFKCLHKIEEEGLIKGLMIPGKIKNIHLFFSKDCCSFSTAKSVRDRLNHPKRLDHYTVSNGELAAAGKVLHWTGAWAEWLLSKEYVNAFFNEFSKSISTLFESTKKMILEDINLENSPPQSRKKATNGSLPQLPDLPPKGSDKRLK